MNILYINHYAGSPKMGMEFRPYYLAKEWINKGHDVTIIAGSYSHLRKENPVVDKDFTEEIIDGIRYVWIKTRSYSSNGSARAMSMVDFCKKIYKNAKNISRKYKPSVVISSSTYTFDTYPSQRITKISKCKYIHEAHDLWPLTLVEVGGMSKFHPFVIAMGKAEKSAYKNSDAVISLFPKAYEHMLKHGLQNMDKYSCIPNGISLSEWSDAENIDEEYKKLDEEHRNLLKRLKRDGKFIVCYLGGHAISNALIYLIKAAKISRHNEDISYVLVGDGMEKDRLRQIAKAEGLGNIFFLPPIQKTKVPALLSMADALYVGAEKSSLYRFGVSMNKVYDYMMSAKPIIYAVLAANNDIEEAKCGIVIEPENPDEIFNAILELKALSKKERNEMGERGKEYVLSHYDYRILAEKFFFFFEQ